MSIYADKGLLIYSIVMAAIFGAVMGSFLNCAAYRISKGESFVKGRSYCPSCGHELGVLDLVPVFSWVLLGGKCRYCKTPISPRYVLAEITMALLSVGCLLKFDISILCLRNFIFICCLFCLALVDMQSYIIPDGCLIISAIAWVVTAPFLVLGKSGIINSLLAAVIYGGGMLILSLVMDRVLKKESLGGGDIKLFAVVGLYLGLAGTLFALLLASILGLLFIAFKSKKKGEIIPFGPAIVIATIFMLFFGESLINWYLGLLSF